MRASRRRADRSSPSSAATSPNVLRSSSASTPPSPWRAHRLGHLKREPSLGLRRRVEGERPGQPPLAHPLRLVGEEPARPDLRRESACRVRFSAQCSRPDVSLNVATYSQQSSHLLSAWQPPRTSKRRDYVDVSSSSLRYFFEIDTTAEGACGKAVEHGARATRDPRHESERRARTMLSLDALRLLRHPRSGATILHARSAARTVVSVHALVPAPASSPCAWTTPCSSNRVAP